MSDNHENVDAFDALLAAAERARMFLAQSDDDSATANSVLAQLSIAIGRALAQKAQNAAKTGSKGRT